MKPVSFEEILIEIDVDQTGLLPDHTSPTGFRVHHELIAQVKRLKTQYPNAKIVLVTGYSSADILSHFSRSKFIEALTQAGLNVDGVVTSFSPYHEKNGTVHFGNYYSESIKPVEDLIHIKKCEMEEKDHTAAEPDDAWRRDILPNLATHIETLRTELGKAKPAEPRKLTNLFGLLAKGSTPAQNIPFTRQLFDEALASLGEAPIQEGTGNTFAIYDIAFGIAKLTATTDAAKAVIENQIAKAKTTEQKYKLAKKFMNALSGFNRQRLFEIFNVINNLKQGEIALEANNEANARINQLAEQERLKFGSQTMPLQREQWLKGKGHMHLHAKDRMQIQVNNTWFVFDDSASVAKFVMISQQFAHQNVVGLAAQYEPGTVAFLPMLQNKKLADPCLLIGNQVLAINDENITNAMYDFFCCVAEPRFNNPTREKNPDTNEYPRVAISEIMQTFSDEQTESFKTLLNVGAFKLLVAKQYVPQENQELLVLLMEMLEAAKTDPQALININEIINELIPGMNLDDVYRNCLNLQTQVEGSDDLKRLQGIANFGKKENLQASMSLLVPALARLLANDVANPLLKATVITTRQYLESLRYATNADTDEALVAFSIQHLNSNNQRYHLFYVLFRHYFFNGQNKLSVFRKHEFLQDNIPVKDGAKFIKLLLQNLPGDSDLTEKQDNAFRSLYQAFYIPENKEKNFAEVVHAWIMANSEMYHTISKEMHLVFADLTLSPDTDSPRPSLMKAMGDEFAHAVENKKPEETQIIFSVCMQFLCGTLNSQTNIQQENRVWQSAISTPPEKNKLCADMIRNASLKTMAMELPIDDIHAARRLVVASLVATRESIPQDKSGSDGQLARAKLENVIFQLCEKNAENNFAKMHEILNNNLSAPGALGRYLSLAFKAIREERDYLNHANEIAIIQKQIDRITQSNYGDVDLKQAKISALGALKSLLEADANKDKPFHEVYATWKTANNFTHDDYANNDALISAARRVAKPKSHQALEDLAKKSEQHFHLRHQLAIEKLEKEIARIEKTKYGESDDRSRKVEVLRGLVTKLQAHQSQLQPADRLVANWKNQVASKDAQPNGIVLAERRRTYLNKPFAQPHSQATVEAIAANKRIQVN